LLHIVNKAFNAVFTEVAELAVVADGIAVPQKVAYKYGITVFTKLNGKSSVAVRVLSHSVRYLNHAFYASVVCGGSRLSIYIAEPRC